MKTQILNVANGRDKKDSLGFEKLAKWLDSIKERQRAFSARLGFIRAKSAKNPLIELVALKKERLDSSAESSVKLINTLANASLKAQKEAPMRINTNIPSLLNTNSFNKFFAFIENAKRAGVDSAQELQECREALEQLEAKIDSNISKLKSMIAYEVLKDLEKGKYCLARVMLKGDKSFKGFIRLSAVGDICYSSDFINEKALDSSQIDEIEILSDEAVGLRDKSEFEKAIRAQFKSLSEAEIRDIVDKRYPTQETLSSHFSWADTKDR